MRTLLTLLLTVGTLSADEYVVQMKPGPMTLSGGTVMHSRGNLAKVETDDPEALADNPNVGVVEKNQTYQLPDTQNIPGAPTDALKEQQQYTWGQLQMVLDWGWEQRTDEPVKVAVLDTGIDNEHPDIPDFERGQIKSFVDDEPTGMDYRGHGTHVAGTIAAAHNNIGVVGVAPGVELYVAKIFGRNGGASLFDIVSALDWCKRNEIDIINASWGGGGESALMKQAIADSGTLFVNAAGNAGVNVDETEVYPGSYDLPNIVVVSAVDDILMRPWWSNYGRQSVDLSAPGERILSTVPGGGYGYKRGTSMAAPHVTGLAAVVWQGSVEATKERMLEMGYSLSWMRSPFASFVKPAPDPGEGQDPDR